MHTSFFITENETNPFAGMKAYIAEERIDVSDSLRGRLAAGPEKTSEASIVILSEGFYQIEKKERGKLRYI